MATIKTFSTTNQTTTDQVIADLNTSFGNLNTDKIEAASTDTLTNKTIDADNNTISNINSTHCDATGSDNNIVSGTAGTSNNLVKWDANGDAIDAGVATSTTAPSASSDDTTVPTSEATHEAINTAITGLPNTSTILVPFISFAQNSTDVSLATAYDAASSNTPGLYQPGVSLGANEYAQAYINIPSGISSITASLVMRDSGSGGGTHNVVVETAAFTDGSNLPSSTSTSQTYAHTFSSTEVDFKDVSTAISTTAGDYYVRVKSDATNFMPYFLKLVFNYS